MLKNVKIASIANTIHSHYIDDNNVIRWRAHAANDLMGTASHHKPLVPFIKTQNSAAHETYYVSGAEEVLIGSIHTQVLVDVRDTGLAPPDDSFENIKEFTAAYVSPNYLAQRTAVADINTFLAQHKSVEFKIAEERRKAILNRYYELATLYKDSDARARDTKIIEEVASETYLATRTIINVLRHFGVVRTTYGLAPTAQYTVDKKSPEYKELSYQRIITHTRALEAGLPCSIHWRDLLINGDVPIICPVFRIRLDYYNRQSLYAPRIWYKHPGKGLVGNNYCVMSKAATVMISGKRVSPVRMNNILAIPQGMELWREWCETYGLEFNRTSGRD